MIRRGFTLFELIVSLAILSVVSTLAVSAFISANDYWNDLRAADQLNQNATAALDSLRDDFGRVLPSRVSSDALRGRTGTVTDDSHFWRTTFEDDRMEMTVDQYNTVTRQRETATVGYFIDRHSGTAPCLVRTARGAATTETVVAPNVAGLRLAWFDGKRWLDAWEQPGLPRAVRVSLSLIDPDRPGRNLARTAEFNVNVP
jgi:prepilin-type N-terminal cleavage/methylation domain-containing protein